ncbi:MAG: HEAT repeat domain-containing protein, partial [Candidatus Kapaibacterium sp.]
LTDTSWRRRRIAAATIGEIGDSASMLVLQGALADPHPYVRQRATYHTARMLGGDASQLVPQLSDTLQIVRMAAVEGLVRGTKRPMASILPIVDGHPDHRSLPSIMRLLAASDTTTSDVATFSQWWSRQDASGKGLVRRVSAVLPRPLIDVMDGMMTSPPTEPRK